MAEDKGVVQGKGEQHIVAHKQVSNEGCGNGGDQQGDQGRHGKVEHQDFKDEDSACDGSLKNSCNGTGSTTADQQRCGFIIEPEQAGEVGTDGRAGKHDGCLRSDRPPESQGQGTGDQGGKGVVWPDLTVIF